jgi:hypothetical protein
MSRRNPGFTTFTSSDIRPKCSNTVYTRVPM